jgi:hypothetical protein
MMGTSKMANVRNKLGIMVIDVLLSFSFATILYILNLFAFLLIPAQLLGDDLLLIDVLCLPFVRVYRCVLCISHTIHLI